MPEYPSEEEKEPTPIVGAPEPGIVGPPHEPVKWKKYTPEGVEKVHKPPPAVVVGAPEPVGVPTPSPPKSPRPPRPPTFATIPVTTFTDIPRRDLVSVQTSYAQMHPEAVIKVGEHYYRPAVPAGWGKASESSAETYVRRLEHLQATKRFETTREHYERLYKELRQRADRLEKRRIVLRQKPITPEIRRQLDALSSQEAVLRQEAKEINGWLQELKHRVKSLKGIERIHALSVLRPYLTKEGIDIVVAIDAGVDLAEIRRIGVPESTIIEVQRHLRRLKALFTKMTDGFWIATKELKNISEETPELYKVLRARGYKAYLETSEQEVKEFKKAHIELADGNWVAITDWNKLPSEIQSIALKDGLEAVDKYIKKQEDIATYISGPTIRRAGTAPIPEEIRSFLKPEGVSDIDFSKMRPFIDNMGRIDVVGAISADVPKRVILQTTQISDGDFKDFKWMADYEDAGYFGKMKMVAERDPADFAKTVGESMIPFHGTSKFWKDLKPWERGVSVVGDVLFVIPVIAGVTAGVKTGMGLGRAGLVTGRGIIVSPYTALRHPVQTFKVMTSPIETLLRPRKVPLGVIWRGEYAPMSIMKVGAGEYPMVTRMGMEEVTRLATAGKRAKVVLPTGEVIVYSDTGLQKILGTATIHTTPMGASFTKQGLVVKQPLFTAPSGSYSLTYSSATGSMGKYVVMGDKIIGGLGKLGQVFDAKGVLIGRVKIGVRVIGLDGKVIGTVGKDGTIVKAGKVIGNLDMGGIAVTVDGKRAIGWLTDGAKVLSVVDKSRIGKLKSLPAFAIIRTEGVKNLPKWMTDAKTIAKMEKIGDEALAKSKVGKGLLPVYKQYKKWIEFENIYAKNSRLIPVLDSKGKPVILMTRGLAGEKIAVPLLQEVNPDWLKKSITLAKSLAGKEAKAVKPVSFSKVASLPKKSAKAVMGWFKGNKDATIYGSFAEYVQAGTKIPNDIDVAVLSPMKSARELARIIEKSSGATTQIVKTPLDGVAVKVLVKGVWKTAIDLHPQRVLTKALPYGLKRIPPVTIDGVRMEGLSMQLQRLALKTIEDWGEAPVRLLRVAERLGVKTELGIGARAPTLKQLYLLKTRGAYNVVRDIFVKGLTKKKRISLTKMLAPDRVKDVGKMIDLESDMVKASRELKVAKGARATALKAERMRLDEQYRMLVARLQADLRGRVVLLSRLLEVLPARYSARAEEEYRRLTGMRTPSRVVASPRVITARRASIRSQRAVVKRLTRRMVMPRRGMIPSRVLPRVPARVPTRVPPRVPPRIPPTRKIRRLKEIIEEKLVPVKPIKRVLLVKKVVRKKEKVEGRIAWRQGALKIRGKVRGQWYVISPPYKSVKDIHRQFTKPVGAHLLKGVGSAYRTIQQLGGNPDILLNIDIGAFDIRIKTPKRRGERGALVFKRDIKQKTRQPITMKEVRTI